jgi:hypothetical protein
MMRKFPLLTLFASAFLLTACQTSSPGIACPFGPEYLASSPDDVRFTIDNQSCTTICRVYVGAPSCDDWGLDLLEEGANRIAHGTSYSFQIPPGTYDLLVEECTEDAYQMAEIDLSEGGKWTYGLEGMTEGQACSASLTVVNQGSSPICHMWIAGQESESFGNNWLENEESISSGEAMTFAVLPGTYDVKAEDCDFNILRLELDKPILQPETWTVP